ncbi:MAG: Hsp70 family protein [Myxococcaceae bacterium]|nr:Hsp70 family protein [Myxococcaceae bacterium]
MSAKHAVGIDLGTTHSAVSYLALDAEEGRGPRQAVLPIPQLTAPGTVESKLLLPSFLYLPTADEFSPDALTLPWKSSASVIAGELARTHGAKVPGRCISSAKSWLCHPTADRRSGLLPPLAPEDVPKLSPVDASTRLVDHLRRAYEKSFGGKLFDQHVVLTVPASFDASARALTVEAAGKAGLEKVTLLEEPQAALYAWLEASGDGFRKHLKAGDVILVVDVGGGTSDFSLISVGETAGNLELERLAVGDHILLGGDNMDLALAYTLAEKLKAQDKVLDTWQIAALTHACRAAKEKLFEDPSLSKVPVTIAGRGSSLLASTVKTELTREELTALLTDGFFPVVQVTEQPQAPRGSGLRQMGLPYAADAAVTRHLAAFLSRQARSLKAEGGKGKSFLHPTSVLFNGGVFKAQVLRERVLSVLNTWLKVDGGERVAELPGADLELAVARGAAYYAWVKQGHGIRIRGGTARAYYVGVESAMPAVPGFAPKVKALCVAPFGMEEGSTADVPPQEFGVVVGEQTQFRFFSSSTRRDDKTGDLLEDASALDGLEELPPIETTLPEGKGKMAGVIPVQLQAAVTELGMLELRCLEKAGKGRWMLELNVRSKE